MSLALCGSNDLSLDALQETINLLGPRVSSQDPSCIYQACANEMVTLAIVQLLYNTLPGALRLRNEYNRLPIHYLCGNYDLDDTASIDILQFMLNINHTLPREVDNFGYLPIHSAVKYKSTAFCKILIDAHPESLRIESGDGRLPIHDTCAYGNRDDTVDTIQYMLELDTELINAENSYEWLPIHYAAQFGNAKLIELLLKYEPDAASMEVLTRELVAWPLHLACNYNTNLSSIKVLYDAYPEAILASDGGRRTPLDLARKEGNTIIVDFLETQLVYAQQSRNTTFMTTIDDDGWLPLHRALKSNAPLGSVKLLMRANPAALNVADQNGTYPLHIACEFSSVNLIKYLVELAGDDLNKVDAKNNSLLHYACRAGNLCALKYLLERNVPSVSERNNDNKLPLHLLLECEENTHQINVDKGSIEYIETVWLLLLANSDGVIYGTTVPFFGFYFTEGGD